MYGTGAEYSAPAKMGMCVCDTRAFSPFSALTHVQNISRVCVCVCVCVVTCNAMPAQVCNTHGHNDGALGSHASACTATHLTVVLPLVAQRHLSDDEVGRV